MVSRSHRSLAEARVHGEIAGKEQGALMVRQSHTDTSVENLSEHDTHVENCADTSWLFACSCSSRKGCAAGRLSESEESILLGKFAQHLSSTTAVWHSTGRLILSLALRLDHGIAVNARHQTPSIFPETPGSNRTATCSWRVILVASL